MSISILEKAELTIFADTHDVKEGQSYQIGNSTYTLIKSYSNSDNGYQGYAYRANDGRIYVVASGSYDVSNFENIFTSDAYSLKTKKTIENVSWIKLIRNLVVERMFSH